MNRIRSLARSLTRAMVKPLASPVVGDVSGGVVLLEDWYLIAEGDSITASNTPDPVSYARLLPALYDTSPGISVPAVAGTNMTSMQGRQAAVEATIASELSRDAVVLSTMMGNGLIEYIPSLLYIELIAYWQDIRDAGAKIVANAILHRDNDAQAPGWDTGISVDTFNDLQRSDPSLYDEFCDFSTQSYGTLAAAADTDLYPDGIHPSESLYAQMVTFYKSSVDKILNVQRPANTVAPAISGTVRNGQTLTCSTGTWSGGSVNAYQWFRLATETGYQVPIDGETSSSYVVSADDYGSTLKYNVRCQASGLSVWKATLFSTTVASYLGPELIATGAFGEGNLTGWTAAAGGTIANSSNRLRLTQPGGQTHARVYQNFTTETGEWYRVSLDFTAGTNAPAGRMFIQDTTGPTNLIIKDIPTTGSYEWIFQATSTTSYIDLRDPATATAGSTWLFDNVSIRKLSDNPYDQFAAFDYTTADLTSGSTATVGAGDGPDNRSDEYDISLPTNAYHYKRYNANTELKQAFGIGDVVVVRVYVKATAGAKIPFRVYSGSGDFILHTATGGWDLLEITHTISFNVFPLSFGFDNRSGVVTGAGTALSVTVWGVSIQFE